jgi:hypothetical protein
MMRHNLRSDRGLLLFDFLTKMFARHPGRVRFLQRCELFRLIQRQYTDIESTLTVKIQEGFKKIPSATKQVRDRIVKHTVPAPLMGLSDHPSKDLVAEATSELAKELAFDRRMREFAQTVGLRTVTQKW